MSRQTVNPEALSLRLREADVTMDVYDELSAFGEQMLAEVQARNETIETKALSMIGWTSTALAVLLAVGPRVVVAPRLSIFFAVVGAIAAIVALVFSARALQLRSWRWPSQQDWFREELLCDVRKLRRYHLIGWLQTHEAHASCLEGKADALKAAQRAFVVMGLALGATVMLEATSRWLGLAS